MLRRTLQLRHLYSSRLSTAQTPPEKQPHSLRRQTPPEGSVSVTSGHVVRNSMTRQIYSRLVFKRHGEVWSRDSCLDADWRKLLERQVSVLPVASC